MLFEWSDFKARQNQKKHHVSFEEGATIFHDPFIATMPDPDHSEEEERYISIGLSVKKRLLVVTHTERNNRTRIINCRKPTPSERRIYEQSQN
ncbi:MAG: BrnT family toxin [Chloroflexi bacterium]|nr:BrnT family toxin [Chloroflexota bacterium]